VDVTGRLRGLAALLGAAVASGLLLAAVFPPLGWSALAFVAWTPLILTQFLVRDGGRRTRSLGAISVGIFVGLLAMSVNPPEVVTGPAWIGISLAVGLLSGVIALTFALPGQTPRMHRHLRGWGFVWLPALSWTGVEYLRLVTTAGHQWGMTATAQIDVAPLRAFLPLAGMWPVTAITVATNYAIAGLLLLLVRRAEGMQGALVTGVATVAAAWILGVALAVGAPTPPGATIRVAAVQTGEDVPSHPLTQPLITTAQYPELTDVITGIHTPGTVAAANGGAQLIVWPEASGWVDPADPNAADQTERVRELARAADATIVWPYFIRIDPNRTRNELVLVNARGEVSSPTT
jgi:apolipoprotein N-acyltransferase